MRSVTYKPLLLVLSLLPCMALANEAHICKSGSLPQSSANAVLSDATSFMCGEGLSGTIPELSRAGWQIVQVTEQSDSTALAALQQRKTPVNPDELTKTYWQLVIQK